MKIRAIRPVGHHYSFCLTPSYHSAANAFLDRCRYHLVRNVIPTLLGLLIMGGITLYLSAQIYGARMDREKISGSNGKKGREEAPDLAKEILKFKI